MLYRNYYYYFKEVIPKHICNDIVKYALTKNSQKGIIGDSQKENIQSKKYKLNLQKIRNSNIVWLREPWLYSLIMPFVHEQINTQVGILILIFQRIVSLLYIIKISFMIGTLILLLKKMFIKHNKE